MASSLKTTQYVMEIKRLLLTSYRKLLGVSAKPKQIQIKNYIFAVTCKGFYAFIFRQLRSSITSEIQ